MWYIPALELVVKGMAVVMVFSFPLLALRMWLRRPARQQGADPAIGARLERIELAIDTIAVEMERLSEGQRFTTKLLSQQDAAIR